MMTLARGVLRREILVGHAPHEVLAATNATLHDDLAGAGLFITIFCARLDPATGILEYANAGQTLPLLRRADGTVQELDAEGMPAGFLPDVEYDAGSTPFGPDDRLLLVTDGVVEARGDDGEFFGEARLHDLVAGHAGGAAALVDDVFSAVGAWMGTQPQTDDVTLVALAGRQVPAAG
jgi:sigma-B regulation protein RsbU (phosphoserine phosphatase)